MLRIDLQDEPARRMNERASRGRRSIRGRIVDWSVAQQLGAGATNVTWTLSSVLGCLGVAAGMLVWHRRVADDHARVSQAYATAMEDSMRLAALVDSLAILQASADSARARHRRFAPAPPVLASALLALVGDSLSRTVSVTQLSAGNNGTVVIQGQAASVPAVLGAMRQLPLSVLHEPRLDHISRETAGGPVAFRIQASALPVSNLGNTQ